MPAPWRIVPRRDPPGKTGGAMLTEPLFWVLLVPALKPCYENLKSCMAQCFKAKYCFGWRYVFHRAATIQIYLWPI
jgi:hypothetical protein